MNSVFSHPMFYMIVGGWVLSAWYLRYMTKKYKEDKSFVGVFEPRLLFLVLTALLITAIFKGIVGG